MGRGGGGGGGLTGVAGAVLAAELCAPLLLLCGLCCWPDEAHSDTSSTGRHPQRPVVTQGGARGRSSRRASEAAPRRANGSAASLLLPGTSGQSRQQLSAHRSHEEISRKWRSHLMPEEESRYHSAPSVIDEVLHRRDWEHSSRDLYIPLRLEGEHSDADSDSLEAPCAQPESSSVECLSRETLAPPCKKHYTNIKSSRNRTKKESVQMDVKDMDVTEHEPNATDFYIGEVRTGAALDARVKDALSEEKIKSMYKAKEAKQSLNESIKWKKRVAADDECYSPDSLQEYQEQAAHPARRRDAGVASERDTPLPALSVEAVGYEGGACYLMESEAVAALPVRGALGPARRGRARHASDGDILAPALRPESGAFSESDLELELELAVASEEPPAYVDLCGRAIDSKETAI